MVLIGAGNSAEFLAFFRFYNVWLARWLFLKEKPLTCVGFCV